MGRVDVIVHGDSETLVGGVDVVHGGSETVVVGNTKEFSEPVVGGVDVSV